MTAFALIARQSVQQWLQLRLLSQGMRLAMVTGQAPMVTADHLRS
ncbi:MAG: hypothetical protein N4A65_00095 [Cohaesibacter sp.]|jgi:hypothetical protein|nr:hypothetical protein [Cohaesibacter sp.]